METFAVDQAGFDRMDLNNNPRNNGDGQSLLTPNHTWRATSRVENRTWMKNTEAFDSCHFLSGSL